MHHLQPTYYVTPGWVVTPPPSHGFVNRHPYFPSSSTSVAPYPIYFDSRSADYGAPEGDTGLVAHPYTAESSRYLHGRSRQWSPWTQQYSTVYPWTPHLSQVAARAVLHALLDGSRTFGWHAHAEADFSARYLIVRHRNQPLSSVQCDAPATSPGVTRLRIVCDMIPEWPVELSLADVSLMRSRPGRAIISCITVADVMYAVYTSLQAQVTREEWMRLTPSQAVEVARNYRRRAKACASAECEIRRGGVRRVDCLGGKCHFGGLIWLQSDGGVARVGLILDDR